MAHVYDVAAYMLKSGGAMTAMKLEKLVYYAQAWSLVWDDKPLFDASIQAWANGPVCPALYQAHKGQFMLAVGAIDGNADALNPTEKDTCNKVLEFYGKKSSQWLSDLTHGEKPWIDARAGLSAGERGDNEITHAAMAEYYGSL